MLQQLWNLPANQGLEWKHHWQENWAITLAVHMSFCNWVIDIPFLLHFLIVLNSASTKSILAKFRNSHRMTNSKQDKLQPTSSIIIYRYNQKEKHNCTKVKLESMCWNTVNSHIKNLSHKTLDLNDNAHKNTCFFSEIRSWYYSYNGYAYISINLAAISSKNFP